MEKKEIEKTVETLERNGCLIFDKSIVYPEENTSFEPGIKLWGKLDALLNQGFRFVTFNYFEHLQHRKRVLS